MSAIRWSRSATLLLLVSMVLGVSLAPVAAQEAGTDTGDVSFRMALKGLVDGRDAFLVIIDCDDEWCADETVGPILPDGKIVIFCGPNVADAPACVPDTYEFTVELQTGPMEYWFYRIRDLPGDSAYQLLHSGSGEIHAVSQTVTMEYVYSGGGAPTLPNTAVPAP